MSSSENPDEPAHILLAEDNPGDVRLTREAFKQGDISSTLHVVTDGVEALDFLYGRNEHADSQRPDIVLLDLNLPRKNGDEVLREINEDPDLSRTPVVVLTSSAAEEDIDQSYELRANAYLTKPVDPDVFIEMVRTFEQFWLSLAHLPTGEN